MLIHGDCLEIMQDLTPASIDMVLCDLPYGQTARNPWDEVIPFAPLWEQYERVCKENAAIVLFAGGMFTARLVASNPAMWRYNLVWVKTHPTGFLNANRMPLRAHEDICVFYRRLPTYHPQKTFGHTRKTSLVAHRKDPVETLNYREHGRRDYDSDERYPTSVLHFAKDSQKNALHPTQKPVALLEYLVKTYSNEGDTVLDNTMGSGSTGVACKNTGRNFIGIEQDEHFFEIAQRRVGNN